MLPNQNKNAKQGNYETFENPDIIAKRRYRNGATPVGWNELISSNTIDEEIRQSIKDFIRQDRLP